MTKQRCKECRHLPEGEVVTGHDHRIAAKTDANVIEFLRESNAIEGVYSDDMLQQAIWAWEYLMEFDEITPQTVRKVHKILMLHSDLFPDQEGYYRNCPIYVGGKAIDTPAIFVKDYVGDWCKEMNQKIKQFTPEQAERWTREKHVQYEKIHPFVDGNGRTGRMFMNWHRLVKLGLPLLTIHWGGEQQAYYQWFK